MEHEISTAGTKELKSRQHVFRTDNSEQWDNTEVQAGRLTTYKGHLTRHPNGDWSKEGVDEATASGVVVETVMWKESFRQDGDYWEKHAFIKRPAEDEESFQNNKGYRKIKVRHY